MSVRERFDCTALSGRDDVNESLWVRIRDMEGKAGITVPIIYCSGKVLVEDGHLINRMKKKQRRSMLLIVSVTNNTDRPWAARSPEPEDHECGSSDFPFMDNEFVRDQRYQLNVYKSMGF